MSLSDLVASLRNCRSCLYWIRGCPLWSWCDLNTQFNSKNFFSACTVYGERSLTDFVIFFTQSISLLLVLLFKIFWVMLANIWTGSGKFLWIIFPLKLPKCTHVALNLIEKHYPVFCFVFCASFLRNLRPKLRNSWYMYSLCSLILPVCNFCLFFLENEEPNSKAK